MNTGPGSKRRHYLTRVGVFLLAAGLVVAATGCVYDTGLDSGPPSEYQLTISSTEGGSVTMPGEDTFTYDAAKMVTLVATPADGYHFVNWTGNVGTIANVDGASTTITMNGNYSITANFAEGAAPVQYSLTISSGAGGSVSTPGEGTSTYNAGTVVNLVASPAGGYQFVNWTGDTGTIANVNAASTTITMNGNYSITANFGEGPPPIEYSLTISSGAGGSVDTPGEGTFTRNAGTVVDLEATPAGGYLFVNWTGDTGTIANVNAASTTITMNGNYSITANFGEGPPLIEYSLTISSGTGGSVTTPGEGTSTYDPGTVVNLVASPAAGYVFVNWTGDTGTIANVNAASTTITMNGNYSITANFAEGPPPIEYSLTISSGAGGSVTTPGEGTFPYDAGTVVNLVASPVSGYGFVNWTGDTGTIANVNAASTTITMNGDYAITANFEEGDGVIFPDPNLEAAIREALGKPTGPIYESELAGLTSLSASHSTITDLTGLEHCINLTSLDLSQNRISDISALTGLTSLTWLDLSYNRISDISPLASLTNLKWLYLHNNQISVISSLSGLTNLTYLFLHANLISDISPLAGLTSLTRLLLFSNQIDDISPLSGLANLKWLYIYKNQISDISSLTGLTKLTQLDVSYNQISTISGLDNLTGLTYLSLRSNLISDISPLADLVNLMWLYLDDNQISDIEPLVDNDGLGTGDRVYLEGNPLSDDSLNTYIPELEARGVIVVA